MKKCLRCELIKPLEMFAKGTRYKDGRRNICKQCHSDYMVQYYKDNPDKAAAKRSLNKPSERGRPTWNRHGFTEETWNAFCRDMCPICNIRPAKFIDHDHNCCPGQFGCPRCVRDHLCNQCNNVLGMAGDSIEILEAAIKYLQNHNRP